MPSRRSVRALALTAVACALGTTGVLACSTILGLGDIRESACIGDATACDGGDDVAGDTSDAPIDARPDVPCMPVTVADAAPATSCAPVEAGACAPSALDGGVVWIPPRIIHGACTTAQIDAFYAACVGPNRTDSMCSAYERDQATAACYGCIVSDIASPKLGPVVIFAVDGGGFITDLNVGGCIAALDPCNEACGRAVQRYVLCKFAACPAQCFPASALAACAAQAATCPCADLYTAAEDCANVLTSMGSPAAVCDPPGIQYLQHLEVVGGALCGGN
jgi:hypothetical protein